MITLLTSLALAATAIVVAVIIVITGWFPRLAALGARGLEALMQTALGPPTLTPRERAELAARLWVA